MSLKHEISSDDCYHYAESILVLDAISLHELGVNRGCLCSSADFLGT